ncbi:hypothetical protein, partial [Pseudophaeobacter sp.]
KCHSLSTHQPWPECKSSSFERWQQLRTSFPMMKTPLNRPRGAVHEQLERCVAAFALPPFVDLAAFS